MNKNMIFCVSGQDLVGKTTQCKLLTRVTGARYWKFPDDNTPTGQLIRAALNEQMIEVRRYQGNIIRSSGYYKKFTSEWFQALNLMARLEAQEEIKETLKTKHIVMDRYDIDSLVYGVEDGCSPEWIDNLIKPLIPSDIVIIIDGPQFPREGETPDVNERDPEFMNRIRNRYLELSGVLGWKIINTVPGSPEYSIQETHKKILSYVNAMIKCPYDEEALLRSLEAKDAQSR